MFCLTADWQVSIIWTRNYSSNVFQRVKLCVVISIVPRTLRQWSIGSPFEDSTANNPRELKSLVHLHRH